MKKENLVLNLKANTRFSKTILQKLQTNETLEDDSSDFIGGIIRDGQLAWIAFGAQLEVFSMKTGSKVASYSFDSSHRLSNTIITCVEEIQIVGINGCLLLVGVQCSPLGGLLYVFSIHGSRVINRIDIIDRITSCCFIEPKTCKLSTLAKFDGCAAIGTDEGKVFLLDLNLKKCKEIIFQRRLFNPDNDSSACKIMLASAPFVEILAEHKRAKHENVNFGIQLEALPKPSPILSLLSMQPLLTIAVGLADGRLILYTLNDLSAFHLAFPPERNLPLCKLTYIEPADDPRACVYLWAFHASANVSVAVMHSIAFEAKNIQDNDYLYENFQSCSPRLTIPITNSSAQPIACQSISRIVSDEEDELLSLCLLGWSSRESGARILVFDLNQWYKEQMPEVCDWREYPSYLAPFPIDVQESPLYVWINPKTVATFNSIQRPEEHFYPTSLSFDCFAITPTAFSRLYWPGLQNKALNMLSSIGASAVLEPDACFYEILETCLFPQFSDQNYHLNPSTRVKQEFLLSMALEYGCMPLLKQCARLWADGSHTGNRTNDEPLTLSTLTEWIWSQATAIKDCCNSLCVPLFDHSGLSIDLRSRKILAHCSRQLKSLTELLDMIVTECRQYIPDEIYETLCHQRDSIRMTSEYQEVLQWLLNMGLLPEVSWNQRHDTQLSLPGTPNMLSEAFTPIPFPYRILHEYYTAQRQKFFEFDRSFLTPKTNSCKCLYIDSFIERECNSPQLRKEWKGGIDDGLYPPPSLQAMLRVLLVPGISLDSKYALFVYLFLDLNMALDDERYLRVVQNLIKFPAVFKLNPTLIKTTQAFWNLDHKEFETALDELISPLSNDRFISTWQQELLVHTLLVQDQPNLALRALRSPGPTINTLLEMKTLLANNLITEAFELQRTKCDEKLLLEFFRGCQHLKKWNFVLGLALTEREGALLIKYLRDNESIGILSDNLQLLYLLQRNKYIDALTYLETNKYKSRPIEVRRKLENTRDTIFSAYKMTMAPAERKLSELFLTIKDAQPRLTSTSTHGMRPLSSELNATVFDGNANIFGNIFQRAIASTKATGFGQVSTNDQQYIPFLSKPQIDFDYFENIQHRPVHSATLYAGAAKRRKEITYDDGEQIQPAAKRRRHGSFTISNERTTFDINPSLLTSFKNKGMSVVETPKRRKNDDSFEGETTAEQTNLLSTPVVQSSRNERRANDRNERAQTPHSILKHRPIDFESRRSTSPSLTVNSARRSVDFDERSLRFGSTARGLDLSGEEYRLTAIQEREENVSPYVNIKGRNALDSSSGDEFYSPENTKVIDEQNEINDESHVVQRQFEEMSDSDAGIRKEAGEMLTHKQPKTRLRSSSREPELLNSTKITQSSEKISVTTRRRLRSASRESDAKPSNSRQLRSASREPEPSTSKRMTRSQSKQLLDEEISPKINDKLDTSTPLRSIGGRASINLLIQPLTNVTTSSNPTKTFIERIKRKSISKDVEFESKEAEKVDVEPIKRSNVLEDKSYAGESFMQQSNVCSESSTIATPRKNVLRDSSSFYSKKDCTSATDDSIQRSMEVQEEEEEEEEEGNESANKADHKTSEKDPELPETVAIDEPIHSESVEEMELDEQPEKTPAEEKSAEPVASVQHAKGKKNVLRDESYVSDSFSKSIVYESQTTETSTFFTLQSKNVLDESSLGPTLAEHSEHQQAVELDADDIEDEEKSNSSLMSTSSTNSSESSQSSSESHRSDESDRNQLSLDEYSNEQSKQSSDDGVINISSSDDEPEIQETQEINIENDIETVDYTDGDNALPEQTFATAAIEFARSNEALSEERAHERPKTSSSDYNLTELQAAPIDQILIAEPQEISEMIYSDLGVSEMIEQSANAVYLDSVTSTNEFTLQTTEYQTITTVSVQETLSVDTLDRGFIDDSAMLVTPAVSETIDESTTSKVEKTFAEESQFESEETNVLEQAMIAEHRDSGMDTSLISMPSTITSQEEVSQVKNTTPKRRRRSSSVSEKSEISTASTARRSTRAKSVTADVQTPKKSTLRERRATSHQSLTGIDEENVADATPRRIMTRRRSQMIDAVAEELPQTPTTRSRRRTISEASESGISPPILKKAPSIRSLDKSVVTTPTRRSARLRDSDVDSNLSTPSRQSVDRESITSASKIRTRRQTTEQLESPEENQSGHKTPSTRQTRSKRSATRDDDEKSEASSIASKPADDDNVSVKSTKSTRRGRPPSTLPIIAEVETEKMAATTDEYLPSGRRLTRAQRAAMEKYSMKSRQLDSSTASTSRRTRKTSQMDETEAEAEERSEHFDESEDDDKSMASNTSRLSRASKTSQASRASKRLQKKKTAAK